MSNETVTKTLPSGEQVIQYPDGREVLQPRNVLSGMLDANTEQQEAASDALREQLLDAADDKRSAMAEGSSVPSDKRPV